MELNADDKKCIESLVATIGDKMSKADIEKTYAEKKASIVSSFPNDNAQGIANRMFNVVASSVRGRIFNASNTKKYKAIILTVGAPKDLWKNQRAQILQEYEALKREGRQQEAINSGKVKVDPATGKVWAIAPAIRKDGQPSGMAGKPLDDGPEAFQQDIYGITYTEDKSGKKVRPFVLNVKGANVYTGVLDTDCEYEFDAYETKKQEGSLLMLGSSAPNFKETTDEFIQQGREKVGLYKMVLGTFKEYVFEPKDTDKWLEQGQIPALYQNKCMVVNNALLVAPNLLTRKGNASWMVDQSVTSFSGKVSVNKIPIKCNSPNPKQLSFAEGTTGLVIGGGFLGTQNQNSAEKQLVMSGCAFIPDPDRTVPLPKNVKPIDDIESIESQPADGSSAVEDQWGA